MHKDLDTLLGRALPPVLSPGFADRVVARVQFQGGSHGLNSPSKWRATAFAVAASITVCAGLLWWNGTPTGPQIAILPGLPSAPTEEEILLKALTTLEVNSGDLALVAQLGEVLEAELSERTSWLEKE
jgi:hypothetical protein